MGEQLELAYVLIIVIGAGCLLLASIACGSADHGRREQETADKSTPVDDPIRYPVAHRQSS
jgi:hypothetical protein